MGVFFFVMHMYSPFSSRTASVSYILHCIDGQTPASHTDTDQSCTCHLNIPTDKDTPVVGEIINKARFLVSDNGFLQIFYNCLTGDEIFSWHS